MNILFDKIVLIEHDCMKDRIELLFQLLIDNVGHCVPIRLPITQSLHHKGSLILGSGTNYPDYSVSTQRRIIRVFNRVQ